MNSRGEDLKKYEQIIRYAMEMELNGSRFFKENAKKFVEPTSEALFLKLAEVEMEHYRYLENQLNSIINTNKLDLSQEVLDRDEDIFQSRAESEHLVSTLQESQIPDITILRMAYLIERDFKEFYMEASKNADDKDIKSLFDKLASWEKGHEELFKKEYDKRMKEYMNLPWGG